MQYIMDQNSTIVTKLNQQLPVAELFKYYFASSNPIETWKTDRIKKSYWNLEKKLTLQQVRH